MRLVFSAQAKDLATAPTLTRSAGLEEENGSESIPAFPLHGTRFMSNAGRVNKPQKFF